MEENRSFSWTNLFIKIILGIIFILLAVWLISLSNRGLSNSLNVLTEDIFAKNIERMKEVGKEYFTIERLPEKVGDIRTLTLERMYDKNLILKLTDKHGNACSAENSYVSIEKYENEYQMKVYLECGEESDYVIVIMGCYDYCDTDICELKEDEEVKTIEYQYKKTTGGHWTDYGKWSEWSKVSVTNTNYRQVETKVVNEEYIYDKTVTDTLYTSFEATCPSGYKKTADGTKCYKSTTSTVYEDAVCPSLSGYTLTGQDGFTCNYSKTTTSSANPTCPSLSGYTLTGQDGFTCNYSKTTTSTTNPTCPTKSGWTFTSRNGFTCNYSKTTTTTSTTDYKLSYLFTSNYTYRPSSTSTRYYKVINTDYVYSCETTCSATTIYTVDVYEKVYNTVTNTSTTTDSATCPSGYSKSGSTCVKSTTDTTTGSATCPSGYNKSGSTCVKSTTDTTTGSATCPSGYSKSGSTCVKSTTDITTGSATCPSGYSKSGNRCVKNITNYNYKDLLNVCPTGYSKTSDGTKCYKDVEVTETVTEVREVTYYRYRVREYVGGTTDYKWSTSKNDKKLLDAGYKLTGKTR